MRKKLIGIFVVGILIITGFASIPTKAGPALQPLTSPDPQIIDMIQQVNESLLYEYNTHLTSFGPRYTGTRNCRRAAEYIYTTFNEMGLDVEFQKWYHNGYFSKNVVATLPGTEVNSTAVYIFCAHYDTVAFSPGANDDGSGMAAVLATAKILSQYSFPYTIRFIAFSGEEQAVYGSYCCARDVSQRGDNIVAVINAEYIGYANTTEGGQTIRFFCLERSKWLGDFITTVNTVYRNQINMAVEIVPNSIYSDHQSFINNGFDAVMALNYDLDDAYHTRFDTSDRINWTYLTKGTKLLLAVVAELASTPLELQVIITKPYHGYFYFLNLPLLRLNFDTDFLYSLSGIPVILGYAKLNVDVFPYDDIKYVLFCIDGNEQVWQYKSAPHYEWRIRTWDFSFIVGRHSIEVYAYTTSGIAAFDEINIIIYQL
ncbi:Peptidase family M28 [uncultured archaeon]|nr:Peptidase family M28 [uncultured archaeon]